MRALRRSQSRSKIWLAIAILSTCVVASTFRLHHLSIALGSFQDPSADAGAPLASERATPRKGEAGLLPLAFDVSRLESIGLAHGTFFFGPHSQEANVVPDYPFSSSLNKAQVGLLDDEDIDVEKERERCARYDFRLLNETHPKRRRLFAGWLVGDDSLEVLKAVSTEAYNVFHTVSYVEAFRAHNLSPRTMRYYDPEKPSDDLNTLLQLFGPDTKVSVDYYNTSMHEQYAAGEPFHGELFMDYVQREGNTYRWELNGMRPDDVGIIGDADEVFTRDFLRAMQICDVPEFRPGQDCNMAQVKASTLVFESSPECLTKDRRWFHPDAVLGECVDNVGDPSLHPPAAREYSKDANDTTKDQHGLPTEGSFEARDPRFPLWHGTDIRMQFRGNEYGMRDGSATAYHFHNYFKSAEEIHLKYATYGHAKGDRAYNMPIWALADDLKVGVSCAHGRGDRTLDFNNTGSSVLPIYYMNDVNRDNRHRQWQGIVQGEEDYWQKRIDAMQDLENAGEQCWLDCGERAGECPFFCGKKGLCCASAVWDKNNRAPECGDNLGCDDGQCCVAAPE